jgi:hypothetical protein
MSSLDCPPELRENNGAAWPFVQPVNKEEVPDYYTVVQEPMDWSTMSRTWIPTNTRSQTGSFTTLDCETTTYYKVFCLGGTFG